MVYVGGFEYASACHATPRLLESPDLCMSPSTAEADVAKKRVFVSFDYDNDKALKELIIGQAKLPDSPFEVSDFSLKEAAPEREWLAKARAAISRSEVFIIVLGPKTRTASGVLREVAIANELKKTRFQLIGYTNGSESWAVPNGGRVYRWTWDNLKTLLG